MSPDSTMTIKCGIADVAFITLPYTGKNEEFLSKRSNQNLEEFNREGATDDEKINANRSLFNDIFNYFVKGYVLSDEQKTVKNFNENERPSDFFDSKIKQWFYNNIINVNYLSAEEKKS